MSIPLCFKRAPFKAQYCRVFTVISLFLLLPFLASAQCVLACNDDVAVTVGLTCTATITYEMILEGESNAQICSPNGAENFTVDVLLTPQGPVLGTSPQVGYEYVNQKLYARVRHLPSNNFCVGSFILTDDSPPRVDCPPTISVACGDPLDPSFTGQPDTDDICANFELTYEDVVQDMSMMCTPVASEITRTWSVETDRGASNSCVQTINVRRPSLDDVTFPANLNNNPVQALDCNAPSTEPLITGLPSINGTPIDLMNGLCGLSTTFTDNQVKNCGNTFTIIRNWVVIDPCASETRRQTQVIMTMDFNAPELVCPSNLSVNTNSPIDCTTDLVLPAISITDDCATAVSVEMITPLGTIDGNGGLIQGLPAGNNEIVYVVTDECKNEARCTVNVSVEDATAPTLICDDQVSVNLSSNGTGRLKPAAIVLDAFDNCCDVALSIRLMDSADSFAEFIDLDCSTLGTEELMAVVEARDCNDNINFCMVELNVQDKLPPALTCPTDLTINCTDDYLDLSLTGEAIAVDACSEGNISFTDQINLDECGNGEILRTFQVSGTNGQSAFCTQEIDVVDNEVMQVTFPSDYTTNECVTIEDLDPENLPAPYNQPVLTGASCKMTAVNFDDEIITKDGDICIKILRTWTVYNWCVYDPNVANSEGKYEWTQIIGIEDTTPPDFVCPSNLVMTPGNDCNTDITLPQLGYIDECIPGEVDVTITGDLGPGYLHRNVGEGRYTVNYLVSDVCGNTTECSFTVAIGDTQAPEVSCISGLTFSIMSDGTAEVWASDFDAGSFDNCVSMDQLQFRMGGVPEEGQTMPPLDDSRVYTCNDLGVEVVAFWVGDPYGNWDYCLTYVEVVDDMNFCNDGIINGSISGSIATEAGAWVREVETTLEGENRMTDMTEENGQFTFLGVALGNEYRLRPEKNKVPTEGVSTLDVLLIHKHLLGLRPITSPYQLIAADVDNNGRVSVSDVIQLRDVILGRRDSFEQNKAWRFLPRAYQFPNPVDPWTPAFPEEITVDMLETDQTQVDFVAIKTGDINLSSSRTAQQNAEVRSNSPTLALRSTRQALTAGTIGWIDFKLSETSLLQGGQLELQYDSDKIELLQVESPAWTHGFEQQQTEEGSLRLNWLSTNAIAIDEKEVLLRLQIKALQSTDVENALQLGQRRFPAEAYDENLQLRPLLIEWNASITPGFVVGTPVPNPFSHSTRFELSLPAAGFVQLELWNAAGQLVYQQEKNCKAGYNQLEIEAAALPGEGVYFYTIRSQFGQQQGKVVLF